MMLRCRAQTWPRPTLLANAKTRGKSVLHATFGGQTAEAIPLGSRTPMALEIDRLALTNRVMTSFTSVGNAAECATKRIDGMGEKPQCLYEAGVEPLGRSIQGYQLDVKELPLKGTGAARCRPPRGQAWLRDHRASTQSDERPTGKFPPASRPCTMGQQPCSEGESASF